MAKKGCIPWNKGKKGVYSSETLKKIREAKFGNIPWNKGLVKNTDSRITYGLSGEKNPMWNGGCRTYYQNIAYRVWEEYWREKMPEGYILHHVDGNYRNNDISNLAMITNSLHEKIHKRSVRDVYSGRFISQRTVRVNHELFS